MFFLKILLAMVCVSVPMNSNLYGLTKKQENRIKNLVKSNPRQLSVKEYTFIAEELIKKAPCNFLVFGVGRDSAMWLDLNQNGTTIFLEDNEEWLQKVRSEIPDIQAYLIHYGTTVEQWKELLSNEDRSVLNLELPPFVQDKKWDIIFVDGPNGNIGKTGRMKSIYTASQFAHQYKDVHVFVHDCHRMVEKVYSSTFLFDVNLKLSLDRLRYFYIPMEIPKEEEVVEIL